jgi:signal peptidase I
MVDETKLFRRTVSAVLDEGCDARFRAPGRSMYPAIREGETITVRPVSPAAVKKGDILLYRWQEGVIAHRVVGMEKDAAGNVQLILRGDATGAQAERVSSDQVLGRVIAVDRNGCRIDLYSIRSKVRRVLHPFASGFKQWALRKRILRAQGVNKPR